MNRNSLAVTMGSIAAMLVLQGCISDAERVRRGITNLVDRNEFQAARDFNVKHNIGGIPQTEEERVKDELVENLVKPREAQFIAERIKSLRKGVLSDLENGDDVAARNRIYAFGVTGQPLVDGPVFAMKTALLNSRVNPAAQRRIFSEAEKSIDPLIDAGNFDAAIKAIGGLRPVPAYVDVINKGLGSAGAAAIAQHSEERGVKMLVAKAIGELYTDFAYREGIERRAQRPDWSKVAKELDVVRVAMIADDIPEADAESFKQSMLSGFKALFVDDETGENFTTAELNAAIASMRADYRARISDAVARKLAEADAANAEALRKQVLAIAAQAAAEVDFQARVRAFTEAIGENVEPGLNRILGDGARVLRLSRAGYDVTKTDATGLLLASVFMGFDDCANLALALGANVNGVSSKDPLARTPYLLMLQSGMKGNSLNILARADRSIRDADGFGAVHYAIRAGDAKLLFSMLEAGLDARTASNDGTTPLILAASLEQAPMVNALLAFSSINAVDAKGRTALLCAAECGSLPIVRTLLTAGADINAKSKTGRDGGEDGILEYAVLANAGDMIDFLLDERHAPVTSRAVDYCVIDDKVMALAALVAHGATVSDKHLAAAVKNGDLDMVKYLVSLGRDVNSSEVHGVVGQFLSRTSSVYEYILSQGYR